MKAGDEAVALTAHPIGVLWPSLKPRRAHEKTHRFVLGLILLFALQGFAQEHYTEGPIWQVTLIRVKPTQMDAYLTTLRSSWSHSMTK